MPKLARAAENVKPVDQRLGAVGPAGWRRRSDRLLSRYRGWAQSMTNDTTDTLPGAVPINRNPGAGPAVAWYRSAIPAHGRRSPPCPPAKHSPPPRQDRWPGRWPVCRPQTCGATRPGGFLEGHSLNHVAAALIGRHRLQQRGLAVNTPMPEGRKAYGPKGVETQSGRARRPAHG